MKHLFIINPAAGKADVTAEVRAEAEAACKARDLDYEIRVSQAPGDCTAITRAAAQSGAETRI